MVFTTLAPETLEGATVLALDRCRWQVELAFKRLKTLLDLDALRTQQNSRLGEIWIRGNSSMPWSSSGVPNATPRVALTCWTDPKPAVIRDEHRILHGVVNSALSPRRNHGAFLFGQ
jgi:hypothetical protein